MESKSTIDASDLDLKQLCVYAFDNIIAKLNNKNKPVIPVKFNSLEFPLFVTWTMGKNKDLRGCIGTFASEKLAANLDNYSLIAAFEDSRFPPIELKEVPKLNCGISLLANFEDAKDAFDWEVGKHGIQIEFHDERGSYYRGTFLPEVSSDRNWDKETTLNHLIKKAGYYGDLNDVVKDIKLRRYQSIKIFMSYDDYLQQQNK